MESNLPEILLDAVLGALPFVLVIILLMMRGKRRRQEKVSAVADHVGGEFKPGGTWGPSEVVFTYREHNAQLKYLHARFSHKRAQSVHTSILVFDLASPPPFTVGVFKPRTAILHKIISAGSEIDLHDKKFEENHKTTGSDEIWVRAFLGEAVRDTISKIGRIQTTRKLFVTIKDKKLTITRQPREESAESLVRFVSLGKEIFDGYLETVGRL